MKLSYLTVFCLLSLCCSVCLAGIVICQGCGWELQDGAEKCGHCGRAVERTAESAEAPEEDVPNGDVQHGAAEARVPEALVDSEVKMARKYMEAKDYVLAGMFLKNAAVLNLISDTEENAGRAEAIAEMVKACDSMGLMVQAKCSRCNGTGNRVMSISSLVPGEKSTREVQGSKCPVCNGAGIVRRPGNMDERKFSRGQAEKRYETIQQARKYMKTGGAWLPPGIAEALTVKQLALVRRSTAAPCEECMGFGKTDCGECDATGIIDCPDCDDGNVFIKVNAEFTKMTLSRSEKCRKCKGKGFLLCAKCGGSGGLLCRKCNGNGERPECRKCSGMGYTDCRKCKGSGKVGTEICSYCEGEGVLLCSSCKGDGHR